MQGLKPSVKGTWTLFIINFEFKKSQEPPPELAVTMLPGVVLPSIRNRLRFQAFTTWSEHAMR
jgi:hypothetical protein